MELLSLVASLGVFVAGMTYDARHESEPGVIDVILSAFAGLLVFFGVALFEAIRLFLESKKKPSPPPASVAAVP